MSSAGSAHGRAMRNLRGGQRMNKRTIASAIFLGWRAWRSTDSRRCGAGMWALSRCTRDLLDDMRLRSGAAVLLAAAFFLASPLEAQAAAATPDLAVADWSVKAAHSLASNPPSLDAVEDFTGRAIGESEDNPPVDVCEFRFADLRSSGNLSLIMTVDGGGRGGCNLFYIFDRTPKGLELYKANARGHDLANSVLDINHDGRHELVLWGELAPVATGFSFGELGCEAEWPLIFAWAGNGYSAEVGDQYKDYYQKYLKSVEARLAAYSPESGPAAAQKANPAPTRRGIEISVGPSGEGLAPAPQPSLSQITAPAPTPKAAPIPGWAALNLAQRNYPCTRIEAAKTETFLGIDSASTMSAAIKDSESDDPNERILAAVIFSYLGTQEAEQDLKTLGNDADSRVAGIAKETASFGEDPGPSSRTIVRQVNPPGIPTASFMR